MNAREKKNYIIAIVLSILSHALIAFVYIPQNLMEQPVEFEDFSVKMVEISLQAKAKTKTEVTEKKKELPEQPQKVEKKEVVKPKPKPVPQQATTKEPELPTKNDPQAKPPAEKAAETIGANQEVAEVKPTPSASPTPTPFRPKSMGSGQQMLTSGGDDLPNYPKNAMNEGIEGKVYLKIKVGQKGNVVSALVVQSAKDSRLDNVVLRGVRNYWKFKAYPENYYVNVVFSFSIDEGVTMKFTKAETRP